jgi:potassium-transporting ATPase KdpC subunit
MKKDIVTAVIAVLVLHVMFGLVYPLATTGVAQTLFPGAANGSKVMVDGKLYGSRLLGADFRKPELDAKGQPKKDKLGNPISDPDPRYFQERPSATVPEYNPAATAFSNLGPNNKATLTAIQGNLQTYLALEKPYVPGLTAAGVPVDAVDSSASGVDPHISPANADIQAHRIAAVRSLSLARVMKLIADHTDGRSLGVFGEPGVNVLELNLALDREAPVK